MKKTNKNYKKSFLIKIKKIINFKNNFRKAPKNVKKFQKKTNFKNKKI